MNPEVAVSIQTKSEGARFADGYQTAYNGEAKAVEVAIGDYSVQFELDNYGTLVIDVINAVSKSGYPPVVLEQHGSGGESPSLVLLVK